MTSLSWIQTTTLALTLTSSFSIVVLGESEQYFIRCIADMMRVRFPPGVILQNLSLSERIFFWSMYYCIGKI
jgi:hypothetical protein